MTDFKHSYSTISSFDTCPHSFAEKSIYKTIKFQGNEASRWGSECHKVAEDRITSNKPIAPKYDFMKPAVEQVILSANGQKIEAEKELGITIEKEPTSFWTGKLRGKLDVYFKPTDDKGVIVDWKVAKFSDKYNLETDVFSYLTFCNDPEVQKIKSVLVWLKGEPFPKPTVSVLDRSKDFARLEDSIWSKIDVIEEAIESENFRPKPNGLCKSYCEVLSCKFNGKNN